MVPMVHYLFILMVKNSEITKAIDYIQSQQVGVEVITTWLIFGFQM